MPLNSPFPYTTRTLKSSGPLLGVPVSAAECICLQSSSQNARRETVTISHPLSLSSFVIVCLSLGAGFLLRVVVVVDVTEKNDSIISSTVEGNLEIYQINVMFLYKLKL